MREKKFTYSIVVSSLSWIPGEHGVCNSSVDTAACPWKNRTQICSKQPRRKEKKKSRQAQIKHKIVLGSVYFYENTRTENES